MEAIKCEAFLMAVDNGSLTAAAELLGYTQSDVTRMINSLEEEVGFSLFVRSKKGVVLTENGQTMLPLFRDIVRAHHNAEQLSSDIQGIVEGVLSIGSYLSISAMWMPAILNGFRALYPSIKIRLQEGGNIEMVRWLKEKSVDCCFCAEPNITDIDWIPLYQDEMLVWLPGNHQKSEYSSYPIKELEQEAFIHTLPNNDTDQDRLLAKWNLKPDTCFSTRDAFTTYNMVAAGLGISFNQRLISKNWKGNVKEVPFDPPQYISLGIAIPSLKDSSPATKRFIDCVKAQKNLTGFSF
jgi:DNA-binding transcriptional LysR family regulator